MTVVAAAGLVTIVATWCLVAGIILVANLRSRRAVKDRGAPGHLISWVELIPALVLATVGTAVINRWHAGLGYVVIGALHGALIIAILISQVRRRAR